LKENSKIINPIWHYKRTYTYFANIYLRLLSKDIKDHEHVQIRTLFIEDFKKKSSEIFNDDEKTYITKALLHMFFSMMRSGSGSASDKDYENRKKKIDPIYDTIKNVNAIFNFFSEDAIADLDNKYELFINNEYYETYDILPETVEINNQGGKRKPKKTRKN
jgi:hypothetical protein